jgi:hypothetical protein
MKFKLESKDMDIKELKKLLKMKQEELSEMQVNTFIRNLVCSTSLDIINTGNNDTAVEQNLPTGRRRPSCI